MDQLSEKEDKAMKQGMNDVGDMVINTESRRQISNCRSVWSITFVLLLLLIGYSGCPLAEHLFDLLRPDPDDRREEIEYHLVYGLDVRGLSKEVRADRAIKGAEIYCDGKEQGLTDENGGFRCTKGSLLDVRSGPLTLASGILLDCDSEIHLNNLSQSDHRDLLNPHFLNLMTFLLSRDSDRSPDTGIDLGGPKPRSTQTASGESTALRQPALAKNQRTAYSSNSSIFCDPSPTPPDLTYMSMDGLIDLLKNDSVPPVTSTYESSKAISDPDNPNNDGGVSAKAAKRIGAVMTIVAGAGLEAAGVEKVPMPVLTGIITLLSSFIPVEPTPGTPTEEKILGALDNVSLQLTQISAGMTAIWGDLQEVDFKLDELLQPMDAVSTIRSNYSTLQNNITSLTDYFSDIGEIDFPTACATGSDDCLLKYISESFPAPMISPAANEITTSLDTIYTDVILQQSFQALADGIIDTSVAKYIDSQGIALNNGYSFLENAFTYVLGAVYQGQYVLNQYCALQAAGNIYNEWLLDNPDSTVDNFQKAMTPYTTASGFHGYVCDNRGGTLNYCPYATNCQSDTTPPQNVFNGNPDYRLAFAKEFIVAVAKLVVNLYEFRTEANVGYASPEFPLSTHPIVGRVFDRAVATLVYYGLLEPGVYLTSILPASDMLADNSTFKVAFGPANEQPQELEPIGSVQGFPCPVWSTTGDSTPPELGANTTWNAYLQSFPQDPNEVPANSWSPFFRQADFSWIATDGYAYGSSMSTQSIGSAEYFYSNQTVQPFTLSSPDGLLTFDPTTFQLVPFEYSLPVITAYVGWFFGEPILARSDIWSCEHRLSYSWSDDRYVHDVDETIPVPAGASPKTEILLGTYPGKSEDFLTDAEIYASEGIYPDFLADFLSSSYYPTSMTYANNCTFNFDSVVTSGNTLGFLYDMSAQAIMRAMQPQWGDGTDYGDWLHSCDDAASAAVFTMPFTLSLNNDQETAVCLPQTNSKWTYTSFDYDDPFNMNNSLLVDNDLPAAIDKCGEVWYQWAVSNDTFWNTYGGDETEVRIKYNYQVNSEKVSSWASDGGAPDDMEAVSSDSNITTFQNALVSDILLSTDNQIQKTLTGYFHTHATHDSGCDVEYLLSVERGSCVHMNHLYLFLCSGSGHCPR